jgi:16S rRNA (guanine966-N2)-methyltransferase
VRIIAGEHRGRKIAAPPGLDTRPMLDRVREALFSTLGDRVPDARVLDLFAGSGSLGLESLSRGAGSARMIERNPRTLDVLRANVELLGLSDRARIVRGDALRVDLWRSMLGGAGDEEGFDIVFLDPPYAMVEEPTPRAVLLERIEELLGTGLRPGGVLVVHAPARSLETLRLRGVWRRDERTYGNSALLYLFKPRASPAGRVGT